MQKQYQLKAMITNRKLKGSWLRENKKKSPLKEAATSRLFARLVPSLIINAFFESL